MSAERKSYLVVRKVKTTKIVEQGVHVYAESADEARNAAMKGLENAIVYTQYVYANDEILDIVSVEQKY